MNAEKILKRQAKSLEEYVKAKHNQDECIGFIDGFEKAVELMEEYAKQSKQEEVKCDCKQPRQLEYGMSCLECGGRVSLPKSQPQEKEQPKGRVDVEAKLYGILLKFRDSEEASVGRSVREILKLITTFQDNGLREAAEKVVKNWRKNVLSTQIEKGIDELEKALNQNK